MSDGLEGSFDTTVTGAQHLGDEAALCRIEVLGKLAKDDSLVLGVAREVSNVLVSDLAVLEQLTALDCVLRLLLQSLLVLLQAVDAILLGLEDREEVFANLRLTNLTASVLHRLIVLRFWVAQPNATRALGLHGASGGGLALVALVNVFLLHVLVGTAVSHVLCIGLGLLLLRAAEDVVVVLRSGLAQTNATELLFLVDTNVIIVGLVEVIVDVLVVFGLVELIVVEVVVLVGRLHHVFGGGTISIGLLLLTTTADQRAQPFGSRSFIIFAQKALLSLAGFEQIVAIFLVFLVALVDVALGGPAR